MLTCMWYTHSLYLYLWSAVNNFLFMCTLGKARFLLAVTKTDLAFNYSRWLRLVLLLADFHLLFNLFLSNLYKFGLSFISYHLMLKKRNRDKMRTCLNYIKSNRVSAQLLWAINILGNFSSFFVLSKSQ